MRQIDTQQKSELPVYRQMLRPSALTMLFLGISAGLPILLIFSSLSVWLREAGVERSAVTFFSWAALGYSFKFIWAPLVDMLPLPFLTAGLGRRRGWLLSSQLLVATAIVSMSSIDPAQGEASLVMMALAAVFLGFSSATQDIVIDAYRIEVAEDSLQALLASMYIAGYRIGMLIAGAGSLFLADFFSSGAGGYSYFSWQKTYLIMAAFMGVGILTTLLSREPEVYSKKRAHYSSLDYGRFFLLFLLVATAFGLSFFMFDGYLGFISRWVEDRAVIDPLIAGFFIQVIRFSLSVSVAACVAVICTRFGLVKIEMVESGYIAPIRDFFLRFSFRSALLILLLVGFYRLSDIVLGVVSNVFYLDLGFSKSVIAGITKTFGLGMTLAGGFLGGVLTVRYGVLRILFLGAFLSSATNLLFMFLAGVGSDSVVLTFVIGADNLSAGIATTAFVAFLSSLTSVSFTAVQYAIFSSMMTLLPKLIGGYSGGMVTQMGYSSFFMMTAVMGIPVMLLILIIGRKVSFENA